MIPLKSLGRQSHAQEFTSPGPEVMGDLQREDLAAKTLSRYSRSLLERPGNQVVGNRELPQVTEAQLRLPGML